MTAEEEKTTVRCAECGHEQAVKSGKTGNTRLAYLTNGEADREISLQQQQIEELQQHLAAITA